jgi:glycosyltransferase involved in cell wall biosynthesis
MKPLIEIRVPTYKRPDLLKRALGSIVTQTWGNWVCLVFDDSPDKEGESVVKSFNDPRIKYEPNTVRLGGAGNIDKAFTPVPLAGGSYACTLEDDNWFYSTFLEKNLELCEDKGVDIVLRNQAVWYQEKERVSRTDRTTRGLCWEEGLISVEELHASLLLFEGVSNGGLFWRLNCGVNLFVGSAVSDSGIQEYCRTWQIDRPVWFARQPECAWVAMPAELVTRSVLSNREFSTGRETISRIVYRRYGKASIALILKMARSRGLEQVLWDHLACSGVPQALLNQPSLAIKWAKAFIRRLITKNPLADYAF